MTATTRAEHSIPSRHQAWLKLFVRESRVPANVTARGAIVFVHGTFTPGIAFDCSAPGYSWIDNAALNGFDAYAPDLRGYGRSSRPPFGTGDPSADQPFCRYDEAVQDIGDVVDFALSRTGCERVSLVGWSWGSLTTAMYTLSRPEKVAKLALVSPLSYDGLMARHGKPPVATDPGGQLFALGDFAALCDREDPSRFNRNIRAYGRWSLTDSQNHALASMPPGDPDLWLSPHVAQAFGQDLRKTMGIEGDYAESPTGAQNDLFDFYVRKRKFFEPSDLKTPTLVVRGQHDFANRTPGLNAFFSELGASDKAFLELGNMSHNFFLERNAEFARDTIYTFFSAEPSGDAFRRV